MLIVPKQTAPTLQEFRINTAARLSYIWKSSLICCTGHKQYSYAVKESPSKQQVTAHPRLLIVTKSGLVHWVLTGNAHVLCWKRHSHLLVININLLQRQMMTLPSASFTSSRNEKASCDTSAGIQWGALHGAAPRSPTVASGRLVLAAAWPGTESTAGLPPVTKKSQDDKRVTYS